jgi:probable phosphoglycerate mutase
MPVFLLIRHGMNDYVKKGLLAGRTPGVHLNDKGRAQAQTLAEKLSAAPIKAIYSSPMERAMETAEPIAKALNLEVVALPGLLETDCGEWVGQSLKSLRRLKAWRVVQSTPSVFRFPGGESFEEVQHRFVSELLGLAARHDPKDIVICVSHGDPIKLAIAYFIGLPLDNFQRLGVNTATITALHIGEGGSFLMSLNYDFSFIFPKP